MSHFLVLHLHEQKCSSWNVPLHPGIYCSYGRALGPEGKLLFFVLATFYLEISTLLSRNFDFHNSKFRVKSRNFEI